MVGNLLFTGKPGVGKSTLIGRVVEELAERGPEASGFLTTEVRREDGRREGFRYRTLDGAEGWLARRGMESTHRVASYGVTLEGLERDCVPAIDPERTGAALIVIDEIGKMEAFSRPFREAVERALDSDRVVLATVSRGAGGWIASVRERSDVEIVDVTEANRKALPQEILESITSRSSAD